MKNYQPQTIIKYITQALADNKQFHEKQSVAWWLLEELTQKNKVELLATDKIELTEKQEQKLNKWIHQLNVEHKPLAYILGYIPFGPLKIYTQPPTLIPRPETEEWVLNLLDNLPSQRVQKHLISHFRI